MTYLVDAIIASVLLFVALIAWMWFFYLLLGSPWEEDSTP